MPQEQPQSYKVTLNDGTYHIVTNENRLEDFENLLLSGMYGHATPTTHIQYTPETVRSIEAVVIAD